MLYDSFVGILKLLLPKDFIFFLQNHHVFVVEFVLFKNFVLLEFLRRAYAQFLFLVSLFRVVYLFDI